FFKQKTAYEITRRDWSSDVCSSDLTAPKRSYEGFLLAGAGGGRYPGFAPHRLDLSEPGSVQPLAADTISRIREQALPGVAGALARLSEHRKDVFAPDTLPVAVRVDSLMAEGD